MNKLLTAHTSVLLGSLIGVTHVVFAKSSLYIGGQLGYDNYITNTNHTIIGIDNVKSTINSQGLNAGALIGYQFSIKRLLIAAELGASLSTAKHTNYTYGDVNFGYKLAKATANIRNSYSISLLPGIRFTKSSIAFVRLATVRTYFKFYDNNPPNTSGVPAIESSAYLKGFRVGLGYAYRFNQHITLRCEYDYTKYKSDKFSLGPPDYEQGDQGKFTPKSSQLLASLLYRFT